MDKCFICHNIRIHRDLHGWYEEIKEDLKLTPMVLEFPSFGKTIKMNIFKCEDCLREEKEYMNMEEIEPEKEEKKDEPEKPLPEAPMKKDNLDRE
jgi:hypothetical protein